MTVAANRNGNSFDDIVLTKITRNNEGSINEKPTQPVVEDTAPECSDCTRINYNACCRYISLKRRVPILSWIPEYSADFLIRDIIAGLTVGLTAIPQGIAYAVVAGLEPQYGLYASIMPSLIYSVVGVSKDVVIGPTAIMALMTQSSVLSFGFEYSILLSFLAGWIVLLLGIFQLGFLVEFISMPVTAGFTSAAAITIASSQIVSFLGLKTKSAGVVQSWKNVFTNIDKIRWTDTLLGAATVVILLVGRYAKNKSSNWSGDNALKKIIAKTVWLIALSSNAIVVIFGTLLAFTFSCYKKQPFLLTGSVAGGLPSIDLPPFSVSNGTTTTTFVEMVSNMGSAVIAVPLISIMEMIAIVKSFAKGKVLDASQEMIALGISNIAGSFIGSMPVSGSFTRTAINHASSVATPLGGIFTAALILLALSFLTTLFYYIPKATLAALIITAMVFMIEFHTVIRIWKTKKIDLIPLLVSFFACLFFGLEVGMIFGIATNLSFILYSSARPQITLQWSNINNGEVLIVTPTQNLVFPAAEYIRDLIINCIVEKNAICPVVLLGSHVYNVDSSMAKGIKLLTEDLKARRQQLFLWKWRDSAIKTCVGYDPSLEQYFYFDNPMLALFKSTNINTEQSSIETENDNRNGESKVNIVPTSV